MASITRRRFSAVIQALGVIDFKAEEKFLCLLRILEYIEQGKYFVMKVQYNFFSKLNTPSLLIFRKTTISLRKL